MDVDGIMRAQTVTLVGLNRVSASMGLALKRPEVKLRVLGFDKDERLAKEAQQRGIVDESRWNLINAVAAADIVVLSVPASELEQTLRQIGQDVQAHALVLDISAAKGAGQKWAEMYLQQGHYVGGRPVLAASFLADGRTGVDAATPELFRQSVMCLMPAARAEEKAVETAVNLGLLLGAQPYFLSPEEYDSLEQGLDGAPGLLAAALFRAITQTAGWRDMLRFAGAEFALSTAALHQPDLGYLTMQNKAAALRWLDSLMGELRELRRLVYQGETETLTAILEQLAAARADWLQQRAGNDWQELPIQSADPLTIRERLLGSRPKKEK
ncbi:MAG: prephenate dehydrogenase [Candidatus Promineifilaceae bacterium]